MLVDFPLRLHIEDELSDFLVVLVVAIAVFENPKWVGEGGVVAIARSEVEWVVGVVDVLTSIDFGEMKLEVVARVEAILGKEWRLNETEHIRRGNGAGGVGFCPTVVAKIVGEARVSHVELSGEVLDELDVGVETDVQAIETILLGCGLGIGIAEGEAIHCHVITTLHVHFVVLGECGAIEVLAPIRVVVVHRVPVVVWIVVEERNGRG